MRAGDALRVAVRALQEAGIPDAARDARHLMAFALGVGPDRLTLLIAEDIEPAQNAALMAAVAARVQRQPVSQIVGYRDFWGRRFVVTRDVLDPRPETETLIEAALAQPFERVLDLGTGSGAIVVTLLAERRGATGVASDISAAALAVAARNAAALGVADRLDCVTANWFAGVTGQFDLIVSNPPYIAADEMAGLSSEVRDWEPHLALTPGGDGLAAYRAITAGVGAHLADAGRLMVEIGPTQGGTVAAMFAAAGLVAVQVHHDMDGRDRVVLGHKA